ncbi:MAG: sugar phosphate isomerase/epimerase [candidate division WS1 bacterium]|nr:sugar phosphate isomerase/epimerase [candidate division WS1 bacterium]
MAMRPAVMWMGKLYPPVWRGEEQEPAEQFAMLREMGIEGIDIFARAVDQYGVDTLASALESSGLECSCYYISADLVSDGPEKVEAADAAFPRGIENAQTLGATICFTHGSQHAHKGEDNFQRYLDRLREKLQLFKDVEQKLVIENAGFLLHTGEDMARACEVLADEGLGLCPDTGNFTLWGQDAFDAVMKCMPWAWHFHIKDYAERWEENGAPRGKEAVLGQGVTPVAKVFDMLHERRWSGWVAWEPGPQDEDGIEASVKELLRLIG